MSDDDDSESDASPSRQVPRQIPTLSGLSSLGILMQFAAVMSAAWHIYGLKFSDYPVFPGQKAVLVVMHFAGVVCAVFHWWAALPLVRGRGKAFEGLVIYLAASAVFLGVWSAGSIHFDWTIPINLKRHTLAFDDGLRGLSIDWLFGSVEFGARLIPLLDDSRAPRAVWVMEIVWMATLVGLLLWPRFRHTLRELRNTNDVRGFEGVSVVFFVSGITSVLLWTCVNNRKQASWWEGIALVFFAILPCTPRMFGGIHAMVSPHPATLRTYARLDAGLALGRGLWIAVVLSVNDSLWIHPTMIADVLTFAAIPLSAVLFVESRKFPGLSVSTWTEDVHELRDPARGLSGLGWLLFGNAVLLAMILAGRAASPYLVFKQSAAPLVVGMIFHLWVALEILCDTPRARMMSVVYGGASLFIVPLPLGVLSFDTTTAISMAVNLVLPVTALWLGLRTPSDEDSDYTSRNRAYRTCGNSIARNGYDPLRTMCGFLIRHEHGTASVLHTSLRCSITLPALYSSRFLSLDGVRERRPRPHALSSCTTCKLPLFPQPTRERSRRWCESRLRRV